ncbi:MAG: protein kinase [Deltaproteobacteria bacterium]|nr:protein kinase [Deltaproteobacteria bacterium]
MTGATLPMPVSGGVESRGVIPREIVITGSGAIEGLPPGMVLGDWRIEGKIGEGGMGTVHAATHTVIGKRAAIKVVRAELCRSPLTAERFVQEARVVNQIGHPSIVDIFHIDRLPDGRQYLVMELLHGASLRERLEQGRLSPLFAIDVLLEVAAAARAAHACGVVHRDLKPDNIFLVEGASGAGVKVVDWGIAKLYDPAPSDANSVSLTTTGMVLGTPQYVSPEQARGRALDARSDTYSLGAIAYELFLEAPPFVADNIADVVAMHLRETPPPPSEVWPEIPAALEHLLLAMLAKEAGDRPSLDDVIAILRQVRDELAERVARPSRRAMAVGSLPPPMGEPVSPSQPMPVVGMRPTPMPSMAIALPPELVPTAPRRWPWLVAGGALAVGTVAILVIARPSATVEPPRASAPPAGAARSAVPAPMAPPVIAAPPVSVAPVAPTTLELRVSPAGARIRIDGAPVPMTRGRAIWSAPAGVHELEVDAPGFTPYHRRIDTATTQRLDIALPPSSRRVPVRRPDAPAIDPNGTIEPF